MVRVVAAGLVLSAISGCNCGPTTARARSLIEAEPGVIDFGAAGLGSTPTKALTIRNAGRATLTVSGVVVEPEGSRFFVTNSGSSEIQAGSSTEVSVLFHAGETEGEATGRLRIESDAENAPVLYVPLLAKVLLSTPDGGPDSDGGTDGGPEDAGAIDGGWDAGPDADGGHLEDAGSGDAGGMLDAGCDLAAPIHIPLGGAWAGGVAAGDIDGDGAPDLVAGRTPDSVAILLQLDGGFAPPVSVQVGSFPAGVAIGEFTGDGQADIVVAVSGGGAPDGSRIALLEGNGNGTFKTPVFILTGDAPNRLAVADFNGDGRQDLVTSNSNPNTVSVNYGSGTGLNASTPLSTGQTPMDVVAADLNGDGRPDIVSANYGASSVSVILRFGGGGGGFHPAVGYPVGMQPIDLAVLDLNEDGHLDIVTLNYVTDDLTLLMGDGSGAFGPTVTVPTPASYPRGVAGGDLNCDGIPDLAVAHHSTATLWVLLGSGSGATFTQHTSFALSGSPQQVIRHDLNGDGKPDLVVATSAGLDVFMSK